MENFRFEQRPKAFEEFWIKLQSRKMIEWIIEERASQDIDSFVEDVLNLMSYKQGEFGISKGEIECLICEEWHKAFDPSWQANAFNKWD